MSTTDHKMLVLAYRTLRRRNRREKSPSYSMMYTVLLLLLPPAVAMPLVEPSVLATAPTVKPSGWV